MKFRRSIIAALALIIALAGCAAKPKENHIQTGPKNADTLRSEVLRKISERVIGGIPITGRLAEIKERGAILVALPPEDPPFQSIDPALGLPVGFHPALATEIALLLEVKPNITILKNEQSFQMLDPANGKKYDLVFLPEKSEDCPDDRKLPYFFTGSKKGWKTICVVDNDGSLTAAVREILTYLGETGIYTQLYLTYVRP